MPNGIPSLWGKIGFAMGGAGIGIGGAPVSLLFLYYLTEIVHLRPALAGIVVALPKIWDMLVDPGLGGVVDRWSRQFGRRSPVVMVGAFAYVLALYLMFSLPALEAPWLVMLVATSLLIVSSVTHTALGVSHLALADDMTEDPVRRTNLLAFSAVVTAFLTLAATAAIPLLVVWTGDGAPGYSRMAGIVALFAAATFAIFQAACSAYPMRPIPHDGVELSLLRSIRATLGNGTFVYLIGFLICFGIAAGLVSAFVPFVNQHILRGGATGLSVIGSIVLISSVAAMPLAAFVAGRLGAMTALRIGNLVVAVSFPLLFAASYGPIWASWLAVGLFGIGAGGMAVLLHSMIIDIAKVLLPGRVVVSLGVYLGTLVAAQKLGQSVGGMVAGGLLEVIALAPGAAEQTAHALMVLRIGYALVPFGFAVAGSLLLIRMRAPEAVAPAREGAAVAGPAE